MTALVYSLPDYTNAEIFLSCVFGAALLVVVVVLGACFALHKWVHHA